MTIRHAPLAVLKGIVTKLDAATITNTPLIRSGLWETTKYPNVIVDAGQSVINEAFDGSGEIVRIDCHCFAQDNITHVYEIMDGVKVALADQTITLDYGSFAVCRPRGSNTVLRDPDGRTFHGVISFDVWVDQLQS